MERKQILLTNDDGIQSPGLWAAAQALCDLGFVTVAAPREQSSGMGRSLPASSDGVIKVEKLNVCGRDWTVHSVGGSPAQAVLHGVMEIMPRKPDLVVSGINYGENVASGIAISGTVGAAMEAASLGIPALAMSLEMDAKYNFSYSTDVDFSVAAYFTAYFARIMMERRFPPDVDLLKVDVPSDATAETPWVVTRVSRQTYFIPVPPERASWDKPAKFNYRVQADVDGEPEDSDVYALRMRRLVSVTPLSLDATARTDLRSLDDLLRSG